MKWRGPDEAGDQWPTLGHQVAWMIQNSCAIPDGEFVGEPYILTNEMYEFLLHFYRLDPITGRFVYFRGAQLVRPQKWGKGPFSAAIVCAEAEGPVLFDCWAPEAGVDRLGFEYRQGDPVGRGWPTPLIQITAVSEAQTENVWRALVPMIEKGNLQADIPDTGETRINLPNGGRIQPVTSKARSRLGARVTFVIQDESHDWTQSNGGRKLADTQRRNLAGMKGRFLETTNAWDPLDESVAQQTNEGKEPGVYIDDVEPGPGSIRNKRERYRCMKKVYGDSMSAPDNAPWRPWIEKERIDAEIEALLTRDPQQAERFFLNRKLATESAALEYERWTAAADSTIVVPDRALVTIGVDGARFEDALAIVGCDVEQSYEWVLGIWEVPESERDNELYEHPFHQVDGVMIEAFERFEVWRSYIDPQYIEPLVEKWQGRWGTTKAGSKSGRIVEWPTNRPTAMGMAVRKFNAAVLAGDLKHDGNEIMARHIRNARRQKLNVFDDQHRALFTVTKDRPNSPRKIDAYPAGVLAWEARGDCIAAGPSKAAGGFYAFS